VFSIQELVVVLTVSFYAAGGSDRATRFISAVRKTAAIALMFHTNSPPSTASSQNPISPCWTAVTMW